MATSAIETELLTVAEAADLLKLAKHTVYRLIASGEIPACRIGGSVRIDRAELFAAVASRPIRVEEDTP
jgi:excisionase family DNA binding protein